MLTTVDNQGKSQARLIIISQNRTITNNSTNVYDEPYSEMNARTTFCVTARKLLSNATRVLPTGFE